MGAVRLRQYYGAKELRQEDITQTVTPQSPPQLDFWLPTQTTSWKFRTLSTDDTRRSLSLSSGAVSLGHIVTLLNQVSKPFQSGFEASTKLVSGAWKLGKGT